MKLVKVLCCMLLYERKTKDCAGSWTFQHKILASMFVSLMFAELPNQSPPLTMVCLTGGQRHDLST